jgi:PAS domain-containing protein
MSHTIRPTGVEDLLGEEELIVSKTDLKGRITYANDAFCALAGQSREALRGTTIALAVLEQGEISVLPDGARVHDQKIETADGPRWLAWRWQLATSWMQAL